MDTIFIIVENIQGLDDCGNDDIFEVVQWEMGYFTDEAKVDMTVAVMNADWCKDIPEGEVTEEDECRFGYIPLKQKN